MEEIMGVFALVGFLVAVLAFICSAVWVLGPLDRAAKNRWYPVQFTLADFLCLFILLDLPIGGIQCWVPNGERVTGGVIVADFVVAVTAGVVWWTGVRTLSRAGIHGTWQRCFVLAVVVPVGYAGPFVIGCLPFFIVGFWLDNRDLSLALKLMFAEIALGGALFGLGLFTRAVASASQPGAAAGRPSAR